MGVPKTTALRVLYHIQSRTFSTILASHQTRRRLLLSGLQVFLLLLSKLSPLLSSHCNDLRLRFFLRLSAAPCSLSFWSRQGREVVCRQEVMRLLVISQPTFLVLRTLFCMK